jgi:hypothetical protein
MQAELSAKCGIDVRIHSFHFASFMTASKKGTSIMFEGGGEQAQKQH